MKLSEAQAMLTRLQELAGEWVETGTVVTETATLSPGNGNAAKLGIEWYGTASWCRVSEWSDGTVLLVGKGVGDPWSLPSPTPAQVDEAVRRVLAK